MRKGKVERKTKETEVMVEVDLDGGGTQINTPFGFLNHMLELLSFHSGMGLKITAKGDVEVDPHHTVEDVGITIGEAMKKAMEGSKVRRFGFAAVPMDEALAMVALDISGRPYLSFEAKLEGLVGNLPAELVEEFFHGISRALEATIHIRLLAGKNMHHKVESIFKSFALALREAKTPSERVESTKGSI